MGRELERWDVRHEAGVVWATINRPEVLNALDLKTLDELSTIASEVETDLEARVLVISGAGDRAFCAGGDLRELQNFDDDAVARRSAQAQRAFSDLESLSRPVIAAMHGYVIGGGCELALACDIRVATTDSRIALNEVNLGGIPSWGGTMRLPRLIGRSMATDLILTGRELTGSEAHELRVVQRLAADKPTMIKKVEALATQLATAPAAAVAAAKRAVVQSLDMSPEDSLTAEEAHSRQLSLDENQARARRALGRDQ